MHTEIIVPKLPVLTDGIFDGSPNIGSGESLMEDQLDPLESFKELPIEVIYS